MQSNYYLKTDQYSSHQQIIKLIYKYHPRAGTILDIGCDRGFLGTLLVKSNRLYQIDGVDIDQEKLKIIQHIDKTYRQTYRFDLNLNVWPIKQKYDIVVIADTLEHLLNPRQCLAKIISLVKTNGMFIVSVPNSAFWWARFMLLSGNFPQQNRGIFDQSHLHFYTKKTIFNLLQEVTSIQILKYAQTTVPFQFVIGIYASWLPIKFVYKFFYMFATFWPTLFSYQHIFVCKKNK